MRTVRIQVAYDGSRFFGWQRQDGFESVQESIERALEELVGEPIVIHGSGRTDTGVHALGQVAHFQLDTAMDDDRLRHALNFHLDDGIVIRRAETCRPDFHARFDARAKRYMYVVETGRFRSPFGDKWRHWVCASLDGGAMRRAAKLLEGTHDFASFASAGSPRENTVRTLSQLRWIVRTRWFAFVVQGNGFLYNMVRTIAGTLLEVGQGKRAADSIPELIAARDRKLAGPTAPACGLYLVSVRYPEAVFQGPDRGPNGVPGWFD